MGALLFRYRLAVMVSAFGLALGAALTQRQWAGGAAWLRPLAFVTDAPALRTAVLAGSGLVLWAAFALRTAAEARLGEDVYGQGATERLIREGPFGWLRNPLYLGTWLFFAGAVALWAPLVVWLVGSVLFFAALDLVIRYEEGLLTERYGEAYRRYLADVPRWRPRPPGSGAAPRPSARAYAWAALGNLGLFSLGGFRIGVAAGGWVRGLGALNLALMSVWLLVIVLRRVRRSRAEAA